jgi:hypothetical protein
VTRSNTLRQSSRAEGLDAAGSAPSRFRDSSRSLATGSLLLRQARTRPSNSLTSRSRPSRMKSSAHSAWAWVWVEALTRVSLKGNLDALWPDPHPGLPPFRWKGRGPDDGADGRRPGGG